MYTYIIQFSVSFQPPLVHLRSPYHMQALFALCCLIVLVCMTVFLLFLLWALCSKKKIHITNLYTP